MDKEKIPNAAIGIADLMGKHFSSNQSAEAEILGIVADYSLQLRPDQQKVLGRLQMLALHPKMSEGGKKQLEAFIQNYKNLKRYHDTLNYVGRTIEALSLKKFIESRSIQGQVINQK